MKMISFSILLILGNVIISFANSSAVEEFAKSNVKFASDVYKKIKASTENVIFSPISLQICLALTLEGAKNTTALELSTALSLPPSPTTQAAVRSLKLNLSNDKLTLSSANKLYVAEGFDILPSFINLAKNTYQSDVASINFTNGAEASGIINQWVSEKTNETIQNLIDPNQLNFFTKFVIVNALYFKGLWDRPFKTRNTQIDKFYTSCNSSIDIYMMNAVDNYLYYDSQELQAQFLELTYKNSDISITIVLPHYRNDLIKIENNIENYLKRQNLTTERVAISIPRFNANNLIDFEEVLQKLGVKELFDLKANLTGISKKPGMYVQYIIQKASIDVSEVGTEAAAATAVIGGVRSMPDQPFPPPELYFKADHPFLFHIRDNKSGVILFIGRYVH